MTTAHIKSLCVHVETYASILHTWWITKKLLNIEGLKILSHVHSSMTANNWFWIGWLDLLALLLQLQPTITAHNQWLFKTRSILYWTTSVYSSTVTDLVLIYESVTSSAFVVCWLTLHRWTLNFSRILLWLNHWTPLRMPNDWISWTELTSKRTEYKSPCLTVPLLFSLSMFIHFRGNVLTEPLLSNALFRDIHCSGKMLTEQFPSNGHIHHNMYKHICNVWYI
jgi:hypothetical protein